MSKYTTEVRFICEKYSGLEASSGYKSINTVLANSWSKIFDQNVTFFDPNYKSVLCQKILRHYYLREIATETVGQWLLMMNRKLDEIMPYYNQIYKVTALEYNPLFDVDYTESKNLEGTSKGTVDHGVDFTDTRTDALKTQRTDDLQDTRVDNLTTKLRNDLTTVQSDATEVEVSTEANKTDSNTNLNAYQATPQGSLEMVSEMNYLTDVRKVTDNGTAEDTGHSVETHSGDITTENMGTQTTDYTGDQTTNHDGTQVTDYTGTQTNVNKGSENTASESSNTEDYVLKVVGKRGGGSTAKLIDEYIQALRNVDMMVIEEFEPLMFGLW